ncbi:hypothetical protein HII31_09952 [Pseudocercospora fuligena]|uniref:Uncharacterized protein n=1 Tax=Pseudocercospora fuligena TaxID=685502 RepID=A0A8H6RBA5_9PEZI|nr:hypothetical protein HII31_09952 [Pseudocercospora fuligena]
MDISKHSHDYGIWSANCCYLAIRDRMRERPELQRLDTHLYVKGMMKVKGMRNFLRWDDAKQQQRQLELQTLQTRRRLGVKPLKKWSLEDVRLNRLPPNAFSGEHRWSGVYPSTVITPTSQTPGDPNTAVVIKQEPVIKDKEGDEAGGSMLHDVHSDVYSDWDGFSDGSEWHGTDSEMEWNGCENDS